MTNANSTASTHPHAHALSICWPLICHATIALILGTLIYLLCREVWPVWMSRFLSTTSFAPEMARQWDSAWAYSLPSFLHMYALVLATQAIGSRSCRSNTNTDSISVFALIPCLMIALGLELIQHPVIAIKLMSVSQADVLYSPLARLFTDYASHGTYDPADIYAIVLALLLASAHVLFVKGALENSFCSSRLFENLKERNHATGTD